MEDTTMDGAESPPLTQGLEALLGGLDNMSRSAEKKTSKEPEEGAMEIDHAVAESKTITNNPNPHASLPELSSFVEPLDNTTSSPTASATISPDKPQMEMGVQISQSEIPNLLSTAIDTTNSAETIDTQSITKAHSSEKPQGADSHAQPTIPGLFSSTTNSESLPNTIDQPPQVNSGEIIMEDAPPEISTPQAAQLPTELFSAVAASNSNSATAPLTENPPLSLPISNVTQEELSGGPVIQDALASADTAMDGEDEHPEWEADSSPIESSDDSSSDDSSSDDDSEDGDNAYKLLTPEEQAKILMEAEGSDNEGESKGASKGAGQQPRTMHEIPEVVIPKPDVTITPNMKIIELGIVDVVVENILLVKARTSGEYRVLETGSVLCLEDRSVVGVVAETLGRVEQPLYSLMFTNAAELAEAGLSVGTKVFYSEEHAVYVFTQAIRAIKGTDASNLHDEEVGDEEQEFSDDEKEAEAKKARKQKWRDDRNGKAGQNGHDHPSKQQRGGRAGSSATRQDGGHYDPSQGISYDDNDDGPYKPLARPVGFADNVGRNEAPQEGAYQAGPPGTFDRSNQDNRQSRGRGRGDRDRGRGGRGRGDRGQGGRGNMSRGNPGPPSGPYSPAPYQAQGRGFAQPPQAPLVSPTTQYNPMPQFPHVASGFSQFPQMPQLGQMGQMPQMPQWTQFPPPPPPNPQLLQQFFQAQQQGWQNMPGMSPTAGSPGGGFLNPAFFNGMQNGAPQNPNPNQNPNPGQWNQQGRGRGNGR